MLPSFRKALLILVTGTKRSGTSMWMQVLVAAGLPWIGKEFLGRWDKSIRDANPEGFYESLFRRGVFFATNPDPKTGTFLFPRQCTHHAVKVFIPGLVRTDYAYIDRVVATIRPWRAYCASIQRLYDMEDRFLADLPPEEGPDGKTEQPLERALRHRSRLHPALEWWFENYDLIRDIATRRYPVNLVSYDKMLTDPAAVIPKVIDWIGKGDAETAIAAVKPDLRTQIEPEVEAPVDSEAIEVFDALHHEIAASQSLSPDLLEAMNALNARLEEEWLGGVPRERSAGD
jgi:hypothetical protein